MLLHTPVIFLISNLLRGLTAVLRVTLLPFGALVSSSLLLSRQRVLPARPAAGLGLRAAAEQHPWITALQGNAPVPGIAVSRADNRLYR